MYNISPQIIYVKYVSLIIFPLPILLLLYCAYLFIKMRKLKTTTYQYIAAEVVHKERAEYDWSNNQHCITFSFANGEVKRIPVQPDVYGVLMVGDTGMLAFKERKKDILFISFERNVYSHSF